MIFQRNILEIELSLSVTFGHSFNFHTSNYVDNLKLLTNLESRNSNVMSYVVKICKISQDYYIKLRSIRKLFVVYILSLSLPNNWLSFYKNIWVSYTALSGSKCRFCPKQYTQIIFMKTGRCYPGMNLSVNLWKMRSNPALSRECLNGKYQ